MSDVIARSPNTRVLRLSFDLNGTPNGGSIYAALEGNEMNRITDQIKPYCTELKINAPFVCKNVELKQMFIMLKATYINVQVLPPDDPATAWEKCRENSWMFQATMVCHSSTKRQYSWQEPKIERHTIVAWSDTLDGALTTLAQWCDEHKSTETFFIRDEVDGNKRYFVNP
jgi:hypothetical protein